MPPWRTRLLRRLRLPPPLLAPLAGSLAPLGGAAPRTCATGAGRRAEATAERVAAADQLLLGPRLPPLRRRAEARAGADRHRAAALPPPAAPAARCSGSSRCRLDELLAFHRGELNELPAPPLRDHRRRRDGRRGRAAAPRRRSRPAALRPDRRARRQRPLDRRRAGRRLGGDPRARRRRGRDRLPHPPPPPPHRLWARPSARSSSPARSPSCASRSPAPLAVIAYPNGDHDDAVCAATAAAGYEAAFTTEKGRNDAATDPYRLRRVSVHGADGALAVLWKAADRRGPAGGLAAPAPLSAAPGTEPCPVPGPEPEPPPAAARRRPPAAYRSSGRRAARRGRAPGRA